MGFKQTLKNIGANLGQRAKDGGLVRKLVLGESIDEFNQRVDQVYGERVLNSILKYDPTFNPAAPGPGIGAHYYDLVTRAVIPGTEVIEKTDVAKEVNRKDYIEFGLNFAKMTGLALLAWGTTEAVKGSIPNEVVQNSMGVVQPIAIAAFPFAYASKFKSAFVRIPIQAATAFYAVGSAVSHIGSIFFPGKDPMSQTILSHYNARVVSVKKALEWTAATYTLLRGVKKEVLP
ncbi:Uncharacterised protein [uncultured archaeon]|nr:Uncharacterised protein [uncultured archaeon]